MKPLLLRSLLGIFMALAGSSLWAADSKPVKVFILAGQSNMVGNGIVAADPKRNGGKGSLEYLATNEPTAGIFSALADGPQRWRTRDDVWISYLDRRGALTVGYGANENTIGPNWGLAGSSEMRLMSRCC